MSSSSSYRHTRCARPPDGVARILLDLGKARATPCVAVEVVAPAGDGLLLSPGLERTRASSRNLDFCMRDPRPGCAVRYRGVVHGTLNNCGSEHGPSERDRPEITRVSLKGKNLLQENFGVWCLFRYFTPRSDISAKFKIFVSERTCNPSPCRLLALALPNGRSSPRRPQPLHKKDAAAQRVKVFVDDLRLRDGAQAGSSPHYQCRRCIQGGRW